MKFNYQFAMSALAALTILATSLGCQPKESNVEKKTADFFDNENAVDIEPIFKDATADLGIDFSFETGHVGDEHFFPEIACGGGAFFDYNNDNRLDILFLNGNFDHAGDKKECRNQLYRQNEDGTFTNVTEESGLGGTEYGMGVAIGDINNDGYEDVYVSNYGPDRLYLNSESGKFQEISVAAGIDNPRWGASVAFVDFDRDGWLDIYVSNYVDFYASRHCYRRNGKVDYCGPSSFEATPDKLYRNVSGQQENKETKFLDVTSVSGLAKQKGPGLGVVLLDTNNDDWMDLYVSNDGDANFMLVNETNGAYSDDAILCGTAYDSQGRGQAGMGIATYDFNKDGTQEILVTHQNGETNAFYSGDGNSYVDISVDVGLGSPSYHRTGFGAVFADFDLDGQVDLAVVNGRVTRPLVERNFKGDLNVDDPFWNLYVEPNQLFMNSGKGKFVEARSAKDPFLSDLAVSRGLCKGDIDNDGDIDLLVINAAGKARVYLNQNQSSRSWLSIKATIPSLGNRVAIGAKIEIVAGKETYSEVVSPASSYFSANDSRIHFGLGDIKTVDAINIVWPDGSKEKFQCESVSQQLNLEQGKGEKVE